MGFERMTLWYQCDPLGNDAMKPLMLGAGQLCVHKFPWKRWDVPNVHEINHIIYVNCGNEIKWRISTICLTVLQKFESPPKNFTYQGKLRMQTDQTWLSLHTDVYLI